MHEYICELFLSQCHFSPKSRSLPGFSVQVNAVKRIAFHTTFVNRFIVFEPTRILRFLFRVPVFFYQMPMQEEKKKKQRKILIK